SPAWTVSETPSSACSPPNHLTMSTQRSTGSAPIATALCRCSFSTVTPPPRVDLARAPARGGRRRLRRSGPGACGALLPRRHLRRLDGRVLVLEVLLEDVVVRRLERVEGDRLEVLRRRRRVDRLPEDEAGRLDRSALEGDGRVAQHHDHAGREERAP